MKSNASAVAKQVLYQQWAQDVRDCNSRPADMTVRSWCKQQGLSISTYYWRLRTLRTAYLDAFASDAQPIVSADPKAEVTFVELKPPAVAAQPSDSQAVIRSGSVSIEISESISDSFLLRILEAASHVK